MHFSYCSHHTILCPHLVCIIFWLSLLFQCDFSTASKCGSVPPLLVIAHLQCHFPYLTCMSWCHASCNRSNKLRIVLRLVLWNVGLCFQHWCIFGTFHKNSENPEIFRDNHYAYCGLLIYSKDIFCSERVRGDSAKFVDDNLKCAVFIARQYPSVRPSVRNVPVSEENGLTYRHSFFTIR